MAVFDHITHRAFFDFGMIEMHEKRGRAGTGMAIGHLDFKHRLSVVRHPVPDADCGQHPLRGQCQRIGAPVEGGTLAHGFGQRVDNGHRMPRLRQSQSKRRTIQPAANDHDIRCLRHAPQYARPFGIVHVWSCRYRRQRRIFQGGKGCRTG